MQGGSYFHFCHLKDGRHSSCLVVLRADPCGNHVECWHAGVYGVCGIFFLVFAVSFQHFSVVTLSHFTLTGRD
jgi:hypothetical protein